MRTEFDAAPTKSGRWAKLFGGHQEGWSREALEREAAAEMGGIERPTEEPEQAAEAEAVPAEAPTAHRRRNPWSRFRQILSDEPSDVRRERLEREAAEELGLSR